MNAGKTLFAQVMEFVPWTSFARIVHRYSGNAGERMLSCAEQFQAMAFARLTWRASLRDIEASLSANAAKLYAMGFRSAVRRSTLADANELRDWRLWSGFAAVLIRRARKLYANDSLGVELDNTVYAVLKAPDIPSILVETAFISNPDEEAKLADPDYRKQLVEALATGIKRYFAKNPPLARNRQL